jgi:hypothetical protein
MTSGGIVYIDKMKEETKPPRKQLFNNVMFTLKPQTCLKNPTSYYKPVVFKMRVGLKFCSIFTSFLILTHNWLSFLLLKSGKNLISIFKCNVFFSFFRKDIRKYKVFF